MDVLSTSDGIINGSLSTVWKVALTSTNGALKFVNFNPGDMLTLVVQEDASGSNYTLSFPSSVLWSAGQAPGRSTVANAVSVYQFSYDGTNFRDSSGAPSKLPSRFTASSALSTMALVGAGASLVLSLSGGNGQGTGNLSAAMLVKAKSGAIILSAIDGSGGFVTGGSGGLATGLATPGTTGYKNGKFYADPSGNTVAKGTMSGNALKLNGFGSGKILCGKTDGSVGSCSAAVYGAGKCVCQ